MRTHSRAAADIVIIDSQLEDYELVFSESRLRSVSIHRFATGEVALQDACVTPRTLWIVNVWLPDMTGIYFLRLVRRRAPRCSVFLVGDAYRADDEVAARMAGATAYVCKPVSFTWLEARLPHCRSPAIRAGPSRA